MTDDARIAKYMEKVGSNVKAVFEKAFAGTSRAAGVKAKCIDCMGHENYVNRIRECACTICPLWQYRPYQEKDDDGEANS